MMSRTLLLFLLLVSLGHAARNDACPPRDDDGDVEETILVKIGGSSITNKARKETLHFDHLAWFAESIARISSPKKRFIIIHGAGSYGHFTASEYGLKGQSIQDYMADKTSLNYPTLMKGFSETRHSVQTLNRHVVSSLLKNDVTAMSISPSLGLACPLQSGKDYVARIKQAIVQSLDVGITPVLHGDGCLYSNGNPPAIVGGDDLMQMLAESEEELKIRRAIFITDVDGIYTADPKLDSTATLVPRIKVFRNGTIDASVDASASSHGHDVTGGLRKKLATSMEIARNIPVTIVKVGTKSALDALRGRDEPQVATRLILVNE